MARRKRLIPKFDLATYKTGKLKSYDAVAQNLLRTADALWQWSDSLDTAVRDVVSDGIAHILHAAYDSQAVSLGFDDAAFRAFISGSVAEWFRCRGFAEWYCQGAGTLFNTSRPRELRIRVVRVHDRQKKKKVA